MVGYWLLGFMLGYTALLVFIGKISSKRIKDGDGFFSGGGSFGTLSIIACVTASAGAPVFISVLELSYTGGISACWFGGATMIMLALIGFVLVSRYKSAGMVTFSGVLGDYYGETVRAISSLIIGLTFPMFSVGVVVGVSAALAAALGWPVWLSVAVTSVIILLYVLLGGMYTIGLTQIVNLLTMYLGLALALVVVSVTQGFGKPDDLPPGYYAPFTVGLDTVLVWFFNFITNAVIAQSLFQMIMSCKDAKTGRRGTMMGILGIIPLTVIPASLGMATVLAVPGIDKGLAAFAHYIVESAPAPVAALVFLGLWAAALSFAGPCLFSGGTSLGRDFVRSINKKASAEQLVVYGRYATVILTMMMIVYGFMRAEQAAWWNIFAYNLRNSAIFAPTIAALVWPVASRRATVFTMTTGVAGGLVWYYLGGFSPVVFYLGIHPMWVGMSLGILTLVITSLVEQRRKITIDLLDKNWRFGFLCLALALLGIILLLVRTDVFRVSGLLGNLIFLITMGIFAGSIIFFHFKEEYVSSIKAGWNKENT